MTMIDPTLRGDATSVANYAQRLIDDITANGHYRGRYNTEPALLTIEARPACLVSNHVPTTDYIALRFRSAFAKAAGINYYDLVSWNDSHSTDEVLEVLRKIAEGEGS
jgi:hypothetical protein